MSKPSILITELKTCFPREEITRKLTADYVLGLYEGEGTFTNDRRPNGEIAPCVTISMHYRDKELIEAIRDFFRVHHKVYDYPRKDGRHQAILIIRDMPTLKNIIVPFFKGKLLGHKGTQFNAWLKQFPYLNSLHLRTLEEMTPVNTSPSQYFPGVQESAASHQN